MNATVERSTRDTVGDRLDAIAQNLVRASILIERYTQIGCPPSKRIKRHTASASLTPSLLEQARIKIATAGVNCDLCLLVTMTVPLLNSGAAVGLTRSIGMLSLHKQNIIDRFLAIHERISEADKLADGGHKIKNRVKLRKLATDVLDLCNEAIDIIDEMEV